MAASDLQSTMNAATNGTPPDRPTSAPPPQANLSTNGVPGLALTKTTPLPSTPNPFGSASKHKGMQLGANKVPASSSHFTADWAQEAAAEAEAGQGANPWGTDDLMDVNADQDDWSMSFDQLDVYVVC